MSHLHIEHITSLERPELAPYQTLKRSAAHESLGIFVVEGDKVLLRLLESDFTLISVLIWEERLAEFEPLLRARPEKEIAVFACPKSLMAGMVGFELYQGVLAIAKIPPPLTLETLLATSPKPRFFAALDGLSNAENVGLLVRNCAALGVQGIIVGETSSSPFMRRSVRNSMGTVFKMPVHEVRKPTFGRWAERPREPHRHTLAQTLRELKTQGIRCFAAHPHTDKTMLSQADFTGDCCVVFGSEGHGISPEVLAECEAVVIPMSNEVDSLNVSAAAAVFLYEVNRQRGRA